MSRLGESCCSTLLQRWIFAWMVSLGSMNSFAMRTCLSIAITDMVVIERIIPNGTNSEDSFPAESTSSRSTRGETYEWDEYTQGIILSSFSWTFGICQLPSIYLVNKFTGKWVYGLSLFTVAIFTILTPLVVTTYGATGLILIRAFMGAVEAGSVPASIDLIAKWSPPNERSKITTIALSGLQVGTILGISLSGIVIQHSSIGWPMAFYVFGTICVLWFSAWTVLVYNNPDKHPFITKDEKDYMHKTMKEFIHEETQPIPWRHMVTSLPVWAYLAGRMALEWISPVMIIDLPKYMSDVLEFSIETTGLLLALRNITMWLCSIIFSWFADWLIKTNTMSRTNVRKIFATISTVGPAVLLMGASYAEYDYTTVVVLFTATMGMMGAFYSGVSVNSIDLSPNHSGTLASISELVGSLCGFLVPYTIGVLTPNQSLLEWRVIFWITFAVLCGASLIFNIWGDGEVQYWNDLGSLQGVKQNGLEPTDKRSFLANTTDNENR